MLPFPCSFVTKKAGGDKPKSDDVICGLAAQEGSKYCPRHTYLHNINAAAERDKEFARQEAKRNKQSTASIGGMPKTRAELIERGYQFTGNKDCSCGKPVEWWRTPASRMMPFDPMPLIDSHATSHFATCPRANRFRRAS